MISGFSLQAMAALLGQGRRLEAVSWLLGAAALAWLLVATLVCEAQPAFAFAASVASLAVGLVQTWFAVRVDFDARLFAALASPASSEDTAARLDATLLELGLIDRKTTGRDWPARWRGARRLLRRQAIALALQAATLAAGLALGENATCWNG